MSRSSDVETLGGRGTIVAFLDLLFSCIGIFIAVITLQTVSSQQSAPAVGAHAYFGVLANGSILQATADGIEKTPDIEAAIKRALAATDAVYPRVEVLFSGSGIERKGVVAEAIELLAASLRPARLIETSWRPAASEEALREELERIVEALRTKQPR